MTDVTRLTPPLRRGPFAVPRPPMIGRYLIRSSAKAAVMRLADTALSLLPIRRPPAPAAPRRILLANWAHLGDLTTALGAVRLVRERFPDAHLGFLASSWGKVVIAQSGLVDAVHIVDHPRMNRTAVGRKQKVALYRRTLAAATRDICSIGYEVAIDFYFYFPPAHPQFWRWGIPVRVGYDSGGGGPLLTHPVPWRSRERPVSEHYADLLEAVWPGIVPNSDALRPRLSHEQSDHLPNALAGQQPYIVLHPGAGAPFKDWGPARWETLIDRLADDRRVANHALVLTGAGEVEIAYANALAQRRPGIINLAGRVDWTAFVATITAAEAVICPDTVTGHIAAAVDTPFVALFTGTNDTYHWAPNGRRGRVLIEDVACAPCHRVGCAVMACVRDISPEAVIASLVEVMQADA